MDSVSLVLVPIFLAISLKDSGSIFQFDRIPKFDDRDFRRVDDLIS